MNTNNTNWSDRSPGLDGQPRRSDLFDERNEIVGKAYVWMEELDMDTTFVGESSLGAVSDPLPTLAEAKAWVDAEIAARPKNTEPSGEEQNILGGKDGAAPVSKEDAKPVDTVEPKKKK